VTVKKKIDFVIKFWFD